MKNVPKLMAIVVLVLVIVKTIPTLFKYYNNKCHMRDCLSRLSNTLDFIVYSNLYISIAAASITYVLFKLVGSSMNYVLPIPFFIMFVIYSFNRKTDETEDSISNHRKSIFNKKYNKYSYLGLFTTAYGFFYLSSYNTGIVEINQLSDMIFDGENIATGILVYFIR